MKFYTLFKLCLVIALLFVFCCGCYSNLGRQLFYRLDCYEFKVIDTDNNPVPNAKMNFYYKSNLDISGKHGKYYQQELCTDKEGKIVRFGWVRNTPHLNRVRAEGFYKNSRDFEVENRKTTIKLFPKRNPVVLLSGSVNFKLEDKYHGKMYFRFSDLELSVPFSVECRFAYQWDEKKKIAKWERKHNADFRPDLIFDFQNSKLVSIEFASANIPVVPNHKSVFTGIYEAPKTGYDKVKLSFDDDDDHYFRKPIIFTFPYRGKICYGLIKRIDSWILNRIIFDYQLNLSGDRNLEHDDEAKMQLKMEHHKLIFQQRRNLWCRKFTPFSIKTAIEKAK